MCLFFNDIYTTDIDFRICYNSPMIATNIVELSLHTDETDKVTYFDPELDEHLETDPFQFKIHEIYSFLLDRFPQQYVFGNGNMSMFLQSQQQCIGVHAFISVYDRANIGRFEKYGINNGSFFVNRSRIEALLDILGGNKEGAAHILHNVLLASTEYLDYDPEQSIIPVQSLESLDIRRIEFAQALVESLVS